MCCFYFYLFPQLSRVMQPVETDLRFTSILKRTGYALIILLPL